MSKENLILKIPLPNSIIYCEGGGRKEQEINFWLTESFRIYFYQSVT